MPTYTELMRGFEFGPWRVIPERGLMRDGDHEEHLEPLVMDVFVVLASHGGEVVTKDQLIEEVWEGRPQTDDVITRCISALRRGLQDDARSPAYVETVQRRGYRVMLPVQVPDAPVIDAPVHKQSVRPDLAMIAVGFLAVVAIAWLALIDRQAISGLPDALSSVAVFPFDCLQDSRDSSDHLCFGFAEEAISTLKLVEGTQIVRKRQAFDDGGDIGVDSIVTGSVQIIAGQVKIAARLEDADSGVVIWSETFDADRNSIFDLQRQVANSIRVALDTDYSDSVPATNQPVSFAASEAYALGRYLFEKREQESIVEAIVQFEEAIRLDPNYGPAWLGLAYTYSIWPDYDLKIDRWATFDRALEIMDEGVEADPSIRESAGTVYGYVYHKQNRWTDAMANTLIAVGAESPEADDYNWHPRVLASVGRLEESLEYARRATELDPEYPALISRLAMASFWVNDLEGAERYFEIANRMDYKAWIHSLAHALFLIRTGEIEEAKAWTRIALEEINLNTAWIAPAFDGIVDPAESVQAIGLLDQLEAPGEMPDIVIVTLSVLLGETDRAMQVARGTDGEVGVFEIEIIYIDEFAEFRRHPDFQDFAIEVGLADYWESAGCRWQDDRIDCPG